MRRRLWRPRTLDFETLRVMRATGSIEGGSWTEIVAFWECVRVRGVGRGCVGLEAWVY